MKFLSRVSPFLVFALACAMPAYACYKVELKNQSESDVIGLWIANACFRTYDLHSMLFSRICTHKTTRAGSFEAYDYGWLTTAPEVDVVFKKPDGRYAHIRYMYRDGGFSIEKHNPHSVPHCGLHYTITLTQQILEERY